jgi:hypothetical protein
MNLIDWILNFAALFLWIDWRAGRANRQPQRVISLASALRETSRRGARGWSSLIGFAALVVLRPFFYHSIGSAVDWTPVMDLLAISLAWRSDILARMFAYSTITFSLTLGYYYGCVLFVSATNANAPESEVMHRFVRAQLGWLDKLPWFLKMVLPFVLVAMAWAAAVPLLVWLEIMPSPPGAEVPWAQAGILSLASILAWKWLFIVLFLLHALNTYVYLGTHPMWAFVTAVSGKLLRPLSWLRIGKLDLAPFAAIALVLALAELLVRPLAFRLFERTLA